MVFPFVPHLLKLLMLLTHVATIPQKMLPVKTEKNERSERNEIKLCGRELVREWISICGRVDWKSRALSLEESQTGFRPRKEIVPSSINKDAETLNMMSEFIPDLPQELKAVLSERQPSSRELQQQSVPALKLSSLSLEEFKKMIQKRQSEVEDNSPLELIDLVLDKRSRKKRASFESLSEKCCQVGCTRRDLAKAC